MVPHRNLSPHGGGSLQGPLSLWTTAHQPGVSLETQGQAGKSPEGRMPMLAAGEAPQWDSRLHTNPVSLRQAHTRAVTLIG